MAVLMGPFDILMLVLCAIGFCLNLRGNSIAAIWAMCCALWVGVAIFRGLAA